MGHGLTPTVIRTDSAAEQVGDRNGIGCVCQSLAMGFRMDQGKIQTIITYRRRRRELHQCESFAGGPSRWKCSLLGGKISDTMFIVREVVGKKMLTLTKSISHAHGEHGNKHQEEHLDTRGSHLGVQEDSTSVGCDVLMNS